jgi:hypothetical protein
LPDPALYVNERYLSSGRRGYAKARFLSGIFDSAYHPGRVYRSIFLCRISKNIAQTISALNRVTSVKIDTDVVNLYKVTSAPEPM